MTELEDHLRALQRLEPRPPADMAALRRRAGRRRTRRMAAGAIASLVLVAGVVFAWPAGDDTTRVEIVDDPPATGPPSPPVEPTTTDPTTTTTSPGDPSGFGDIELPPPRTQPPAQFVAVTDDGRLVVVESATGREIRQLAAAGDPTAEPPGEGPGPNVIDRVALSPDGATVWYSECCEPAGGSLFRVPVDGSALPTQVGLGWDPAQPADSRWVAAVDPPGVLVVDTEGGPNRVWRNDANAGEHQEVAWALDGAHLAVRTGMPGEGDLLVVDPNHLATDAAAPLLTFEGPLRLPTFSRDGRILVARRIDGTWSPRQLDPGTGEERPAPFEYDLPPIDQDFDPTGEWLIVLEAPSDTGAGTARWAGPDAQVFTRIDGSYRAASW